MTCLEHKPVKTMNAKQKHGLLSRNSGYNRRTFENVEVSETLRALGRTKAARAGAAAALVDANEEIRQAGQKVRALRCFEPLS